MSLSLWVGKKQFEIGSASFLKAWFSTVFVRLENEDWGSQYPVIMLDFYSGSIPYIRSEDACKELEIIRTRFSEFPPSQIVWDFENRNAKPPWGDQISPTITSLGNYFVTSDGKDLFDVIASAFIESYKTKRDVVIS